MFTSIVADPHCSPTRPSFNSALATARTAAATQQPDIHRENRDNRVATWSVPALARPQHLLRILLLVQQPKIPYLASSRRVLLQFLGLGLPVSSLKHLDSRRLYIK